MLQGLCSLEDFKVVGFSGATGLGPSCPRSFAVKGSFVAWGSGFRVSGKPLAPKPTFLGRIERKHIKESRSLKQVGLA